MTTLMPRGYGNFPSYQFSPPNRVNSGYHYGRYPKQGVFFAPRYPVQPLYQPPFYPIDQNAVLPVNQFRQPNLSTQLVMLFNKLDQQYRQERYARHLQKMQRQYWKQQANRMPPPLYTAPLITTTDSPEVVYQYEKEIQYIPFPVYVGPGARGRPGGVPGSGITSGFGGSMSLPPKIRAIFIPTGQSFSQQPYTGSLAMPPFLYNRMAQPFCTFPLPPPLPQLGAMSLTPAVQQMVIQRYSNPVAVLPFAPNSQMSPMMMPGYPSVFPQQEQCIPPMPYIPALPPPPQPYIPPPAPISVLPPAPQAYIPPPAPQAYIPPPVPQAYGPQLPPPVPISAFPSPLPAPQAYIPPLPDANLVSSLPQYPYSSYPSICRACPPAPPPLNVSVTGHCWVQHCSACHHVPTPISNPNVRPFGGRNTPLLRQPTVPQYIPEQAGQQYYHSNAPIMMRPWLRRTPPLPPGAIVISDTYVDKNGPYRQYDYSQRQYRQHHRRPRDKHRSTTVTSRANPMTNSIALNNNRSMSPRRANNNSNLIQHQESVKVNSARMTTSSSFSSSFSSSGLSTEYDKITLYPSEAKQAALPQRLTREARNVNLQYKYQPEELPNVYLINRYLKSNSEASTLISNTDTSSNNSPSCVEELRRTPSSLSSSTTSKNSIKSKRKSTKKDEKPPHSPSISGKFKGKFIIIREVTTRSPSTMSTISSNMAFSIIDKDDDSMSTTSTLKANSLEEDDIPSRNIF